MMHWGPATTGFVGVTVWLVPFLSFASRRQIVRATRPMPSRHRIFTGSIVTQFILGALALLAAREQHITLFPSFRLSVTGVLCSAAFLGVILGTLPLRWRIRDLAHQRRMVAIVPVTPSERRLWVLLCLSAGFWEEIAYRGTLFAIAFRVTGGWWPAALACSVVFGLAHLVQGWKTGAVIIVIALAQHAVVRVTGTLVIMMVMHALYDLVAGYWLGGHAAEVGSPPAPDGQPAAA
jgi:membrane protease YdiL (CAAX protease family)